MLKRIVVVAACAATVACDSPVDPCTTEGRGTVPVQVRKPVDESGALVPAAGVTVRMEPAASGHCYQMDSAITDAAGIAILDGYSHLTQWRVYVTPPAGFVAAGAATGIPITPTTDTVRATLQFAPTQPLQQMLQEVSAQIFQAIATNQDLLPRNPNSAAQLQAKLALLQRPGLAAEITDFSYFVERVATSMDGRTIGLMSVFTTDTMRAGVSASINYLHQVLPRMEQFMNRPFPTPLIRMWYGFTLGNSGGGGWINMEDRGTYESRTPATRLPFDAILVHELAHSYVGNEALTQFLELYFYNQLLGHSTDASTWTYTRAYVPDAANNANVHALLDVYRLIGRDAMMNAYRAIYALYPPYGSPLSQAVRNAFLAVTPDGERAQVAAKLATITF